jgi:hypothetical protein
VQSEASWDVLSNSSRANGHSPKKVRAGALAVWDPGAVKGVASNARHTRAPVAALMCFLAFCGASPAVCADAY